MSAVSFHLEQGICRGIKGCCIGKVNARCTGGGRLFERQKRHSGVEPLFERRSDPVGRTVRQGYLGYLQTLAMHPDSACRLTDLNVNRNATGKRVLGRIDGQFDSVLRGHDVIAESPHWSVHFVARVLRLCCGRLWCVVRARTSC